ncbi:MAG: radical SAM protein [Phycisphaerales bacterium]|nr:radical SAM protein [Phycisphaerales bacterium]
MTLRINEIFFSIQGESTWVGAPCVFVRLAGCPLRCNYCDTEYAFREGSPRSIDSLVEEVMANPCPLVEITGGEPLAQRDVHTLITRLLDGGRTVLIETSGALDTEPVDRRAHIILDVKTPDSGESHRTHWANLDRLQPHDEVKFVIASRSDYEYAREVTAKHALVARCRAVQFSPVHEQRKGLEILGARGLPPRELAKWILTDQLAVRLQLQMHKVIWDPSTRGV